MAALIVRNDEVVGSIPTSSTNLFNHLYPPFSPSCFHFASKLLNSPDRNQSAHEPSTSSYQPPGAEPPERVGRICP